MPPWSASAKSAGGLVSWVLWRLHELSSCPKPTCRPALEVFMLAWVFRLTCTGCLAHSWAC